MKVFVYGTLKRGCTNHRCLEEGKFVAEAATVDDNFRMLTQQYRAYPFIVRLEEDDTTGIEICGEVFEIDATTLKRLDRLEGYRQGASDNLYERETVYVHEADGTEHKCFVYIFRGDTTNLEVITSGVWTENR